MTARFSKKPLSGVEKTPCGVVKTPCGVEKTPCGLWEGLPADWSWVSKKPHVVSKKPHPDVLESLCADRPLCARSCASYFCEPVLPKATTTHLSTQ